MRKQIAKFDIKITEISLELPINIKRLQKFSSNKMKLLRHIFKKTKDVAPIPKQEAKIQVNEGGFRRLFAKHFIPHLRERNWQGSGFKFYKETENETLHLFEVVPDRRGGGYSIALAIHYNFIPYRFSDKIEEYSYSGLDIRGGLPYEDTSSDLLKYPQTETEIKDAFEFLKKQLELSNSSFFDKFGNWKEYYLKFTPETIADENRDLKNLTNSRLSLLCARVFNQIGEYDRSKEMANYGLSTIKYPTGNGSALYPEFKEIIKAANRVDSREL